MDIEENDSILTTIKKMLNIGEDDTSFDIDIIMNINSVFAILSQLGVGPSNGYRIKDNNDLFNIFAMLDNNDLWNSYISDDDNLDDVVSYIYLKVKLMFDPPLNGTVMNAHQQQISELEWRLNVGAEKS